MIALWHELPANFEAQLAVIGTRAEAYHVDDGHDDAIRAADGFEAQGLHGVFFIISSLIGTPGYVTSAMLRELVQRGHEVGNHTHSHRHAPDLDAGDLRDDIAAAQSILAGITGRYPTRFAWPGGRHTAAADAVARGFGFAEIRDISNVVKRIAIKTDDELRAMFPCG